MVEVEIESGVDVAKIHRQIARLESLLAEARQWGREEEIPELKKWLEWERACLPRPREDRP